MKNKSWILGSFDKDIIAFYLPGALTSFFLFFFPISSDHMIFIFLAWICFGFLDAGHVYTSVWRTYLNKNELGRRKWTYILSPPIIFFIFYFMAFFDFVLLGAIVIYATLYHNMRQFYGMSKWYQKINKSFDKTSDYFFYILCSFSFLIAHFRSDLQISEYFPGGNRFLYPNIFIEKILTFVFFVLLLLWVSYEVFKAYKMNRVEWVRVLSVAFPVALYAVSFIHFKTLATIVFPLVVSHGLSYIVLIHFSVIKVNEKEGMKEGTSWLLALTIGAVAVVFGSIEFYFDDFEFSDPSSSLKPVLTAFLLTPLFCHYYFDSFLWKSDHPDFHKIVS